MQAVQDLPDFGRDPYELIRTMPGITSTGGRSGNGQTVFLGQHEPARANRMPASFKPRIRSRSAQPDSALSRTFITSTE